MFSPMLVWKYKMKFYNPDSERQRGGFNLLSFFFFNKKEEPGWNGLSLPVDTIDLVAFTTLFVEQRVMSAESSLGVKYQTMLMIMRAFAEYDRRYQGRDNGEWLNMDFDNNICSGNKKYAVLYSNNKSASYKVPSQIVFTMFNNHWTVTFNGEYVEPTEEDLSIRIEFFFNLFIMCVNSLKNYDSLSAILLGNVASRVVAHSKVPPEKIGFLSYIWEIYK
jgi:hypothetical protein